MDKLQKELNHSLDLLEEELRLYLEKIYKNKTSGSLLNFYSLKGKDSNLYKLVKKKNNFDDLDLLACLKILNDSWADISLYSGFTSRKRDQISNYIHETKTIRNNYYAHKTRVKIESHEMVIRIYDTLVKFGEELGFNQGVTNEIREIRNDKIVNLNINKEMYLVSTDYDPRDENNLNKGVNENVTYYKSSTGNYEIEIKRIELPRTKKNVLSVPAGITYELISETQIHSCPHDKKKYHYDPTQYITFRNIKGEMDSLYKIDFTLIVKNLKDVIKVDRFGENNVFKLIQKVLKDKKHELSQDELDRLQNYCKTNPFHDNNRFYFLSTNKIIFPKIAFKEKGIASLEERDKGQLPPTYYSLSELVGQKS